MTPTVPAVPVAPVVSTTAATSTSATTATTATSAMPKITVPPAPVSISLKKVPQTSYAQALESMITDFSESYLNPELTPEEKVETLKQLEETTTVIKRLCDKHLLPLYQESMRPPVPQNTTPATPTVTATAAVAPAGKRTVAKLSDWQIYMKYCKELINGYAESTEKNSLAKTHYAQMTKDQKDALREKFYAASPEAAAKAHAAEAAVAAKNSGAKRETGYSMFSKEWYAAFKKEHPEASGLQSTLCGAAWKALPEDQKNAWKALVPK
jgi:hypothetical protein